MRSLLELRNSIQILCITTSLLPRGRVQKGSDPVQIGATKNNTKTFPSEKLAHIRMAREAMCQLIKKNVLGGEL